MLPSAPPISTSRNRHRRNSIISTKKQQLSNEDFSISTFEQAVNKVRKLQNIIATKQAGLQSSICQDILEFQSHKAVQIQLFIRSFFVTHLDVH